MGEIYPPEQPSYAPVPYDKLVLKQILYFPSVALVIDAYLANLII